MDREKLDEAVRNAIVLCGTGPDRFDHLMEYIHVLKYDRHWTDKELANFQARITFLRLLAASPLALPPLIVPPLKAPRRRLGVVGCIKRRFRSAQQKPGCLGVRRRCQPLRAGRLGFHQHCPGESTLTRAKTPRQSDGEGTEHPTAW